MKAGSKRTKALKTFSLLKLSIGCSILLALVYVSNEKRASQLVPRSVVLEKNEAPPAQLAVRENTTTTTTSTSATWQLIKSKFDKEEFTVFPDECSQRAGYNFLHYWKHHTSRFQICNDNSNSPSAASSGQVQKMNNLWLEDNGKQASFVELNNVRVSLENSALVFHLASCEKNYTLDNQDAELQSQLKEIADFRFNDRSMISSSNTSNIMACDENSRDMDVAILMHRFDAHNIYHGFEAVVGSMQTSLLAEIEPDRVPILFTDTSPRAPMIDDLYLAVFGNGALNIDPYYLRQQKHLVCIGRVIIGLASRRGSVVPSTWAWEKTSPCNKNGNPMLQDFASHIVSQLGLQGVTPPSEENDVLKVLWLDRRGSGRQRQVDMSSLTELKQLVENAKISNKKVEFEIWDPETQSSLKEQIYKIRSANMIVGVHGAALTHLVFQTEGAGAIELRPIDHNIAPTLRRSVAHIFRNLAAWCQRRFSLQMVSLYSTRLTPHKLSEGDLNRINESIHSMLLGKNSRSLAVKEVTKETGVQVQSIRYYKHIGTMQSKHF